MKMKLLGQWKAAKKENSTDARGLSMNIVKHIITSVIKPLTYIFNTSFKTGVFPDKLKMAKVIPVFKSGIIEDCFNYRPISLLPQFSKIVEKHLNSRLTGFIDKIPLLTLVIMDSVNILCRQKHQPTCYNSLDSS